MVNQTIVTLTLNPAVDVMAEVGEFYPDRKLRCDTVRRDPGGGGINVARAVRTLGGHSIAVYTAGGPTGAMIDAMLEQEGVEHRSIPTREWTRESLTVLERKTHRLYRFVLPGPSLRESEWRECLEMLNSIEPAPSVVVVSGSLPPGVPSDFFARVARLAKARGARFIGDASGESLRALAEEGVTLLKPNRHEFEDLVGRLVASDGDLAPLGRDLIAQGRVEALLISLAADGALLICKNGACRLKAPAVTVQSTVGAGDSMVAAVALSLSRNQSFEDAARFGMAAGTAAVLSRGTQLFRREDAEGLLKAIQVEPIVI